MTRDYHYVCPECGSTEVVCDAYAEWDYMTQQWVLRSTHDNTDCAGCGATDIDPVKKEGPPPDE